MLGGGWVALYAVNLSERYPQIFADDADLQMENERMLLA
jgi:hypothetical protein